MLVVTFCQVLSTPVTADTMRGRFSVCNEESL